jgi:hypothetical protein
VVSIFKKRKINLSIMFFLDERYELVRFVMRIDTCSQDLCRVMTLLIKEGFQLDELIDTVGSPMPTIKNQDNVFLTSELRKGNSVSRFIFQAEVRSLGAHHHSIKISGDKTEPIHRAKSRCDS